MLAVAEAALTPALLVWVAPVVAVMEAKAARVVLELLTQAEAAVERPVSGPQGALVVQGL
jgi:hypothetical protein